MIAAALLAAATLAAGTIERAAEALRDDPVYVERGAELSLNDDERALVRDRIERGDAGPVYVAVLRAEATRQAGGDPDETLRALIRATRRDGTYALVVGRSFRAASNTLERGEAGRLATEALRAQRDRGVAATLVAFVDNVAQERRRRGRADDAGGNGGGRSDELSLLLLLGVGGAIAFFVIRGRRQRAAELAPVRQAAQEDLLALAEDIRALDLDVEMPNADPAARADYATALGCYERADAALDRARSPEELEPVTAAIEEGRYAMAAAKARLEGRPPPERRPPCFFDPRHGPSDRDVEWAPPGGAPRPVPACEADAQAVERGLEPASREVLVGGERVPYWAAPPVFAPWAGGYFGAFGGLFPAILIGSMLGGGIFAPPAFGGGETDGFDDPGGGDFGDFGGDFGGGDFGGGDFGGGGFGGD